jgi:hypothetical protein
VTLRSGTRVFSADYWASLRWIAVPAVFRIDGLGPKAVTGGGAWDAARAVFFDF